MEWAVFVIFAIAALAGAGGVVMARKPVHAALSLVLTLFSVAVFFVMQGAHFLAAVQVIVYAGAIVVLFLFVIMLLNLQKEETVRAGRGLQVWVALLGAVVFAGMLLLLFWRRAAPAAGPLTEELVSLKALSRVMFTDFLLPFEIVGLLLLVAVIGATVAARKSSDTPGTDLGFERPEEEPAYKEARP
jgi:NADH-quinone oxidoreductase subunit J